MKNPKTIIEVNNASLEIGIRQIRLSNLKQKIKRGSTGGNIETNKGSTRVAALRGITCKIKQGERIALIGHNGAGKSSFLRMISGIYHPTSGGIEINCEVHPMLQKNFLTGVELSGAQAAKAHYLLGNGKSTGFEQFLDEIIEFTQLGDFIHMPIKSYSQGMSSRLLFALYTSGSHDCLALDEGFGTGDAKFFNQAQKRLEKFILSTGTLILASHSDTLLQRFCNRGIVFSQGRIIFDGELKNALSFYNKGNN